MVQPINLCCASMYTEDDSEGNTTGTRRVLEKRPHISNIDFRSERIGGEADVSTLVMCAICTSCHSDSLPAISRVFIQEVTKKKYVVFN